MIEALLTTEEQRILLADIGAIALAVGRALSPRADFGALEVETGALPGALSGREQLAFLEAHLPAIDRAIDRIAPAPCTALRAETVRTPPERARRPNPASVLQAVRDGDLRPVPAEPPCAPTPPDSARPSLASRLGDRLPRTVAETTLAATFDTPENRYLAGLLAGWRRDLRAIAALAAWEGEGDTGARAARCESRLRRLSDTAFLRECPSAAPAPATDRLLRDPRYRAVYELGRRYHRQFRYAWDCEALLLPPRETWLLYEVWCYFRTAAALRTLGWRPVGGDAVRLTGGRLAVTLAKGHASRLVFRRATGLDLSRPHTGKDESIHLFYNRAFASAAVGFREAGSRTHMMIPDICLEQRGKFLLLDAKYRSYATEEADSAARRIDNKDLHSNAALLEDVDKMHAYRDAVVKEGRPVVDAAWCLYPGNGEDDPAIIAYPASTPDNPFGTAGVGAISLRPGRDEGALVQLIAEWAA